jgi:hypothetical protein
MEIEQLTLQAIDLEFILVNLLKALAPYGYKFKLIKGYEFSKFYPFNNYVDHFSNKRELALDLKNS